MRHKYDFRKLNRTSAHRRAMLRNMATSFLRHGSVRTTVPKAKELRRTVEKLITLGGKDSLHNRRKAYAFLMSKEVVQKLFTEIGPKYQSRPGGYTRIVRTRFRRGDAAELAVIQLVEEEYTAKKPEAEKRAKSTSKSSKSKSAKAKSKEKAAAKAQA